MFVQNGYIVKHLILSSSNNKKSSSELIVNEVYTRIHFSSSDLLIDFIRTIKDMLIINLDNREMEENINKTNAQMILNKNFKLYIPYLQKEVNVSNEKEILSLSGILSTMRGYQDINAPYVTRLNLFEIVSKVIFVGILTNISHFYRLNSNINLHINNIPFLNAIYFHFNVFKTFINQFKEQFDKGMSMFPGNQYNYYRTKDNKFISLGNLEQKFQKNFLNVLRSMDKSPKEDYDFRQIQEVLSNFTREEIERKFIDYETCVTPVLTKKEAIEIVRKLNKNIFISSEVSGKKRYQLIEEVEKFLFPCHELGKIIDLSSYINLHSKF